VIYAGEIAASGTHTITGMVSKPRLILFTGTNRDAFDSVITSGARGGFFGFACEASIIDPTIKNYCQFAMMGGGFCSNQSANCAYAQSAQGGFGANTLYQAQVVGLNSDGFTITFTTGAGAGYKIFYFAICDIDATHSFQHSSNCDGDPRDENVGFEPSLVVQVGQWRDTCHTLPKSTSTLPWTSAGLADIAGGTGVLDAEWIMQSYTRNTLNQRWDNLINQPGVSAHISALSKPFVFGSDLALGYLLASTPASNTVRLNEDPGSGSGFDFALAVTGRDCLRMECGKIIAQFAEQTFTLTEIGEFVEGVVFINMEAEPQIQNNTSGRWGFGFATPDFECSWLNDLSAGAMYQTASHGWISAVSATQASYGDTDFAPPTGQIGFITQSLNAGGGATGFGAIKTFCRGEFKVVLDPLRQGFLIGSWTSSRGGFNQ
jgi:hypothetical protein